MSNLLKSKFLMGVLVVAVLVVGVAVALPSVAKADCTISMTLRLGSSGADVQCLQGKIGAMVDGKFGPMTLNAVKAWQAAHMLMADGVVGPKTIAALMGAAPVGQLPAGCQAGWLFNPATGLSCTTGGTTPPPAQSGDLEGGAGDISDADFVSSLSGEEVGEDAEDVEVLGLKIEADEGSDIELMAVRLNFSHSGATADLDEVATEVSVWFDGEEVARVDAEDFTDDNNYDKTVTLDKGAVIKAGDTGELTVALSGVNNLDSGDVGDNWTLEVENVRFEDASGAILTDSSTGDIAGVTRTFSFESFATSADSEFKIAKKSGDAADAINKGHMINVHATEETENVKLLAFTMEAEGDSDLEVKEFGVDLVTSATDVDDVIAGGTSPAVRLIIDGEEYGSASYNEVAANNREVLFDNVDYVLKAGDKVDAYIEVDILAISGDLTEGDTIYAQITETQTSDTALVDVRDESNTQLGDTDLTGSAVGEENQAYDVTFTLETDGWTNTAVQVGGFAGEDDEVTFNLEYSVTAVDGDVYIDNECVEDADGVLTAGANAANGFNFFQSAGTEASIALSCSHTTVGATAATGGNWLVANGETETFKVSIRAIADVNTSFAQVSFEGLGWAAADGADGTRIFEGSLDDTYKSNSVSLTKR